MFHIYENKPTRKAFGLNELGLVGFPSKISGTQISRLLVGEIMGCSYCFSNGIETKIPIGKIDRETERNTVKPNGKARKRVLLNLLK